MNGMKLTLTELLWQRMTEIYGHKWTSAFGDDPLATWDNALASITPAMIRVGLNRLALSPKFVEWPPGALEFRHLCSPRSEDIGLPAFEKALSQALGAHTGKHSSVVHTLREMGHLAYTLRRMKAKEADALFSEWWQRTIDFVIGGGVLPPPAPELTRSSYRCNAEVAQQALEGLRGMFPVEQVRP